MASVTKQDIPEISEFMAVLWGLIKKYWVPENDDAYWKALMDEMNDIGKKYPDRFCTVMMIALADYLEEKLVGKSQAQIRKEEYWKDFFMGRRKETRGDSP